MLAHFFKQTMERQKARFPAYVAKLEAIAMEPDPRKTVILTLASIMAHDLRNELTVIGVVLELEEENERAKADNPVLPA